MLYEELVREEPRRTRSSPTASRLSALVGFLVVAIWGVSATPWPEEFAVTVKFEHLREYGDQYDGIIIGSSNVFRSFVPRVVDAALEAGGVPMRTFNMGGAGMFSYESDYVLRRMLALEKVDPDYVFIEPEDWDPRPKGAGMRDNMLTNRGVHWHDLRQTLAALRGIPPLEEDLSFKLDLALDHLHAFSWKMCSYGQGPRILDRLTGVPQPQSITPERVAAGSGYQSLGELPFEKTIARRRLLTEALEDYALKIRQMVQENAEPLAADADARIAIPKQKAYIESRGAVPIHVMPPAGLERHHAFRLAEEGVIRLMAYNDPQRYPQFYVPERRFDPNHLDRIGALRFSKLFGEDLVQLLLSESEQ